MTFLDAFAGIGGFSLGLEWAGWTCIGQIEVDPYCRRVLTRHWPDVWQRGDIRLVSAEDVRDGCGRIDAIVAGFPCQDLSHAGRRAGASALRSGLWREAIRLVAAARPRWVVLENVHHAWRSWVPGLRSALGHVGYGSLPLRLSAAELGADHHRRRVFVVAHPDCERLRLLARWWSGPHWEVAAEPFDARWGTAVSRVARGDAGFSDGMERCRALGNAVAPPVAQVIGRVILFAEAA